MTPPRKKKRDEPELTPKKPSKCVGSKRLAASLEKKLREKEVVVVEPMKVEKPMTTQEPPEGPVWSASAWYAESAPWTWG